MHYLKLFGAVFLCALWWGAAQAQTNDDQVEEIYVGRSIRVARVVPSDFCATSKTGFAPGLEDQLTYKSITTRTSDGRLTGTNDTIGDVRTCIGQAMDPTVLATYAEGHIAGVPFTAVGDCRLVKGNAPEEGLYSHRCFLSFSNLPEPYVGGFLTSSTMYSKQPFGTESSPPGYAQAGIVIVRLWKRKS